MLSVAFALPNELKRYIFSFLNVKEKNICYLVCKEWQKLLGAEYLDYRVRRKEAAELTQRSWRELSFELSDAHAWLYLPGGACHASLKESNVTLNSIFERCLGIEKKSEVGLNFPSASLHSLPSSRHRICSDPFFYTLSSQANEVLFELWDAQKANRFAMRKLDKEATVERFESDAPWWMLQLNLPNDEYELILGRGNSSYDVTEKLEEMTPVSFISLLKIDDRRALSLFKGLNNERKIKCAIVEISWDEEDIALKVLKQVPHVNKGFLDRVAEGFLFVASEPGCTVTLFDNAFHGRQLESKHRPDETLRYHADYLILGAHLFILAVTTRPYSGTNFLDFEHWDLNAAFSSAANASFTDSQQIYSNPFFYTVSSLLGNTAITSINQHLLALYLPSEKIALYDCDNFAKPLKEIMLHTWIGSPQYNKQYALDKCLKTFAFSFDRIVLEMQKSEWKPSKKRWLRVWVKN